MPELSPAEVTALATAAIRDRLTGFGHNAASRQGKNGPHITRFLAPTEAELAWMAHCAQFRTPTVREDVVQVHPGVVALARRLKGAA